ncbi:hypothetical protein C3Z09_08305 [Lelliottia aquatilis]|nr:hypothetical protein C3Z09_08305 [Lelliottia aquatilis]
MYTVIPDMSNTYLLSAAIYLLIRHNPSTKWLSSLFLHKMTALRKTIKLIKHVKAHKVRNVAPLPRKLHALGARICKDHFTIKMTTIL